MSSDCEGQRRLPNADVETLRDCLARIRVAIYRNPKEGWSERAIRDAIVDALVDAGPWSSKP